MAKILIGYDIHPTKNETYDNLTKAIQNLGSLSWHCLDSTWIVVTSYTAQQVRDELWQHMYSDDQLFVVDITGDAAAWLGFSENCSSWLKKNLAS